MACTGQSPPLPEPICLLAHAPPPKITPSLPSECPSTTLSTPACWFGWCKCTLSQPGSQPCISQQRPGAGLCNSGVVTNMLYGTFATPLDRSVENGSQAWASRRVGKDSTLNLIVVAYSHSVERAFQITLQSVSESSSGTQ